jgi:toxin YhaV
VSDDTFKVNGWTIYAHPLFLDQLEAMTATVERARKKDPRGYRKKRAAKLLAVVLKVAFEDIPGDPTRDIYRQGSTLGEDYKHWFRAKFLQQFRLFFRYQQSGDAKIIVLAWVNDDSSLRVHESASDAYAVFRCSSEATRLILGATFLPQHRIPAQHVGSHELRASPNSRQADDRTDKTRSV